MCNINESVMHNISYVIDSIEKGSGDSNNRLCNIFRALCRTSPYHSILYATISNADNRPFISNLHVDRMPNDHLQYYRSRNIFDIDPVLGYALNQCRAFTWKNACAAYDKHASARLPRLSIYDFKSGVAYAYPQADDGHRAFMSVQYSDVSYSETYWCTLLECLLPHIFHALHKKLYSRYSASFSDSVLTVKESSILTYARDGKTTNEISNELYISSNTVKFHFKNIYEKLSVSNRSHAVAKAISLGIISAENMQ